MLGESVTEKDRVADAAKGRKRDAKRQALIAEGKITESPKVKPKAQKVKVKRAVKPKVKPRVEPQFENPAAKTELSASDLRKMEGYGKDFSQNRDIIIKLHAQVKEAVRTAFENAITIGDLLFRQKKVIPYGEFGRWIEKLPMDVRTAQRYMQLFMYQKLLAKEQITTITEAYARIFDEPTGDKVAEVDDAPIKKTEGRVSEETDIEDLKPPKGRSKGKQINVTFDEPTIDTVINDTYFMGNQNGLYAKIVIEIHPTTKFYRVDEFLHAAEKKLRPGGYVMFRKP